MTDTTSTSRPGTLRKVAQSLHADWSEIGGLGRLAVVGLFASLAVAVGLGFSITASARSHLLDARTHLLETVADDIAATVPGIPQPGTPAYDILDREARLRLLGGETVQIKLWAPDGTIVYSDSTELIGQRFEISAPAARAFAGDSTAVISDLSDPAHAKHREFGELIEFYIPFGSAPSPAAVFEVEQQVDDLNAALGRIRTNVWLSIGSGVTVLAVFLGTLQFARVRAIDRRRRHSERLLGSLLHVQDEERRRIVGSLHDDIGQPLYRLLFGLESIRAKVGTDEAVADEFDTLEEIVRDVDATLRSELRLLHEGSTSDAGLIAAVEGLVDATRRETDLDIGFDAEVPHEPAPVPRAALFRAAREAITNVRKHADASSIEVRLAGDSRQVRLEIRDDGAGISSPPGLGLTTTRERLETIGGGLRLSTRRGRGTRFVAWAPLSTAGEGST